MMRGEYMMNSAHVIDRSDGGEFADLPLAPCWKIFQGGITLHCHLLYVIGCGIHLGDDYVFVVLVLFPQLFPLRGKFLTVATPRGI